jgi:hypothetical protein
MENQENKKVLAGILALLLGYLGVHKFILGYTKEGLFKLYNHCILRISRNYSFHRRNYLPYKIRRRFYNTYQVGKKGWF